MSQKTKEEFSTLKTSYDYSICPTCKGTGWKIYESSPEGYEGVMTYYADKCPTCSGGLHERTEIVKKVSNIPLTFYDKNYLSFDWNIYRDSSGRKIDLSKKKLLVEDFLKNYKRWKSKGYGLYICSKTKGSGKTFLASCLCNELMELYGIRTRFVSATQLLDISKSGDKDSPDEYKREPIKLLCNCELLVIDDIGQKRTGYEWMNEVVFRITDERMTKRLVTIFTSNLTIEELNLEERIKERINKVSLSLRLPEFNVRSKESYDEKLQFMKEMGLVEKEGG